MEIPRHEDEQTEFKLTWSDTVKKTLIAFANTFGGMIWLGINDDGEVCGLDHPDECERSVTAFARHGTEPPMSDLVACRKARVGGRDLLIVQVTPGDMRPYGFRGKRWNGGIYVRDGSSSVSATDEEIIRMIRSSSSIAWEEQESREQKLTFEAAARIFSESGLDFSSAHFRGLGIVSPSGGFTKLGLLVSDQNPTKTKIGWFEGADDKTLQTYRYCTGSVLSQVREVSQVLESHNSPLIQKVPGALERKEKRRWPQVALREALVNAMAHRDYSMSAETTVNLGRQSIEIISFGGIPGGLAPEDIVIRGVSHFRNRNLSEIFHHLKWMEHYGSGFTDIFASYEGTGVTPRIESTRRLFKIILPSVLAEVDPQERIILEAERTGFVTRANVQSLLGISKTSALHLLNSMSSDGRLVGVGSGKARRYIRP